MPRYFALVPAAGGGSRFGAAMPKQYAMLAGAPVLAQTLTRLQQGPQLDGLFVVLATEDREYERMGPQSNVVTALRCGGETRAATVANALSTLAATCADDDWLLVHDAARPCVPRDALSRLVEHLHDDNVGGLLAIPVADTLKRSDRDADAPRVSTTEPRAHLWLAQTPQMFRFGVLRRAFTAPGALLVTDEAQAVEALGKKPRLIPGSPENIKITYPADLALATAILAAQRTGETTR
ncbi:MAG: 2-C-methyl-D-erythritol 4-phosphate cytidylyltransferase [Betaproteobacteria bacterium]